MFGLSDFLIADGLFFLYTQIIDQKLMLTGHKLSKNTPSRDVLPMAGAQMLLTIRCMLPQGSSARQISHSSPWKHVLLSSKN